MNTKLKVLLFTLVLLASMMTEGESFSSASGQVGRKRSTKQVKIARYVRKRTKRVTIRAVLVSERVKS